MEEGIPLSFVFVGAPIVRIVHPWLEVACVYDMRSCLSKDRSYAVETRHGGRHTVLFVLVRAPIVRIVRPWLEVALLWYAMYNLFRSEQRSVFSRLAIPVAISAQASSSSEELAIFVGEHVKLVVSFSSRAEAISDCDKALRT